MLLRRFRQCDVTLCRGIIVNAQRRGLVDVNQQRDATPDRLLEEGGLPNPPAGWRMSTDLNRALLVTSAVDEPLAAKLLKKSDGVPQDIKPPELSIAVTLTASNRKPLNPERREKPSERSLRRKGRRNVLPASPQPSQIPVLFEFAIEALQRDACDAIVGTGCCQGDTLAINSLFFAPTGDVMLDPSAQAAEELEGLYQGPALNQIPLAATLLGRGGQVSPTAPLRQRYINLGNPFFDPVSVHTKFGHLPAHTIAPELYGAIMGFMRHIGFDDELAAFLRQLESGLRTQAQRKWKREVLELVKPAQPPGE